jgi:sugar phosphate isomerase/epimerase
MFRIGIFGGFDVLEDAKNAGFKFAEMTVGSLMPNDSEEDFAPSRKQFENAILPVEAFNCFLPGNLKSTGPDVDYTALEKYINCAVRRAGEIGASIIVFGSGGSRQVPEGFDMTEAWKQLEKTATIAGTAGAKYNVTIVMEPLGKECNIMKKVAEGIEMTDRLNMPNLKTLADLYHMMHAHEDYEIIRTDGGKLGHVHLCGMKIEGYEGGYPFDYDQFFSYLKSSGYTGRISMEDHSGLISSAPSRPDIYTKIVEYFSKY